MHTHGGLRIRQGLSPELPAHLVTPHPRRGERGRHTRCPEGNRHGERHLRDDARPAGGEMSYACHTPLGPEPLCGGRESKDPPPAPPIYGGEETPFVPTFCTPPSWGSREGVFFSHCQSCLRPPPPRCGVDGPSLAQRRQGHSDSHRAYASLL